MRGPVFQCEFPISFGDCDPAGIVFYPNFFRWTDSVFHQYLASVADGHAALCERLGAKGLGLVEATMRFLSPAAPGERMRLQIEAIEWAPKTFALDYSGYIEARPVLKGRETRAVFVEAQGRLRASSTERLRSLVMTHSTYRP